MVVDIKAVVDIEVAGFSALAVWYTRFQFGWGNKFERCHQLHYVMRLSNGMLIRVTDSRIS